MVAAAAVGADQRLEGHRDAGGTVTLDGAEGADTGAECVDAKHEAVADENYEGDCMVWTPGCSSAC